MSSVAEAVAVSLVGLGTTSSAMVGVAIGLYAPLSKRVLACVLAFAAGALISALAIELAFEGAQELHHLGFSVHSAWAFVGGGFVTGAILYYSASLFLEKKGAAIRYPTRFREFALERKQEETKDLIGLLSQCNLLRHLPPEAIEELLPSVRTRELKAGEIVFHAGDPGDALYIVARGKVEVVSQAPRGERVAGNSIAELGAGHAFGEMALLSGEPRTASVQSVGETNLLEIDRENFDRLIASDAQMARAVERLSHERALGRYAALLSMAGSSPSGRPSCSLGPWRRREKCSSGAPNRWRLFFSKRWLVGRCLR